MPRYVKELPMTASRESTFGQIRQYLEGEKFEYRLRDGEQVFQKGKGVWVAPGFIKVTYAGTVVRVEAWIDAMGAEQDLEGVVAVAAKKPLKKHVAKVEQILSLVDPNYVPAAEVPQYCPQCGNPIAPGGSFCSQCGSPAVIQAEIPAAPQSDPIPAGITKKEYLQKYAGESFYSNLRVTAICGYVLCGLLGVAAVANPAFLADLAIYLGLTLGMHLGKSKGCAIGILIYAGAGFILTLVATGSIGGWGWLIIGGYALVIFHNAEKRYKQLAENL